MSFGLGGMGGMGGQVTQFDPPDPIAYNRGPGEGIKGSPYFKFADAIVKTIATYYTMGGTAGMAMNAWKKALTTGDTSQGELYKAGGGGPAHMATPTGRDELNYGLQKGKTWLETKMQELAKAEQASKVGGAGPQGTAMLNQYASGTPPGGINPYTGSWDKDLARWREDLGLGSAGPGYDSSNPWASLINESANSDWLNSGIGETDNLGWGGAANDYYGADNWFNGGNYVADNMDWSSALSDFSDYSDLFSSFGGS